MILTKKDLKYYIEQDAAVYGASKELETKGVIKNIFHKNPYLEYLRVLRKCEYYCNTKKFLRFWYAPKLTKMKLKTRIDVGINVLDSGVHIPHGKVVISSLSTVGSGGGICSDVTIGIANQGDRAAPQIGKNVRIGSGARILGDIRIADNVVIGANSVVTQDILQDGVVVVGIPAKVIRSVKGELTTEQN